LLTNLSLGSPWSSGGFSIQAACASWNLALSQLLWEQTALDHALHFGSRHVIQLVMPAKELCGSIRRCVLFILSLFVNYFDRN
jgi:hypothetical protein